MKSLSLFDVTVQGSLFQRTITTSSTTKGRAIASVMDYELCPRRCIASVDRRELLYMNASTSERFRRANQKQKP